MGKVKRKPSKYNLHVGREMRKGKTMKQAAASWKKGGKTKRAVRAVRKTVKSVRAKRAATKARRKTTKRKTGVRKKMGFNTQKLMKIVRLAALAGPAAATIASAGNMEQKTSALLRDYTGFSINDGSFKFERLARGWGPYLGSILVTYGIPKLAGIIRGL